MSRRSQIVHSPPVPVADALARFGRNIRRAREARGLTQTQLAESAEISRATMVKIEQGGPGTAIGTYFTVLSALGLLGSVRELADPERDPEGIRLDSARLADPGSG